MPLAVWRIKWKSYSPLNIFTCCSSIHKYKSPFLGALLTNTVTTNKRIVFRILIRLKMPIINILEHKNISTEMLLRAHTHGLPPPIARFDSVTTATTNTEEDYWNNYIITNYFLPTWDSLDLRIVTGMYNALSILTYRGKYFPEFTYLLRTKFDYGTGYWIQCLLLISCVKLNTLEILYGTEYAVSTHCNYLNEFHSYHSAVTLPWNSITSSSDICLKY